VSHRGVADIAKAVPVGSAAIVMGTTSVSIALSLDHQETASRALLLVAGVTWVTVTVLLAWRFVADRRRFLAEARSPVGLDGAAANAVLGTRLVGLGWVAAGIVLLLVASTIWLVLLGPVLGEIPARATGVAFMLTVSTEALAVLSATVAVSESAPWLADCALVLAALGIGLYPFALARFDASELLAGRGDQWVSGGALAICALAVSEIIRAAARLGTLAVAIGMLKVIALCLWVGAAFWLPLLLAAEVRRPRDGYDVRRWATVFPLGMYAASGFSVASATQVEGLATFAAVWIWLAFAGWTIVFLALLRHGLRVLATGHSPDRV
jgi:tellurite resistance protein TehA-like permease